MLDFMGLNVQHVCLLDKEAKKSLCQNQLLIEFEWISLLRSIQADAWLGARVKLLSASSSTVVLFFWEPDRCIYNLKSAHSTINVKFI